MLTGRCRMIVKKDIFSSFRGLFINYHFPFLNLILQVHFKCCPLKFISRYYDKKCLFFIVEGIYKTPKVFQVQTVQVEYLSTCALGVGGLLIH